MLLREISIVTRSSVPLRGRFEITRLHVAGVSCMFPQRDSKETASIEECDLSGHIKLYSGYPTGRFSSLFSTHCAGKVGKRFWSCWQVSFTNCYERLLSDWKNSFQTPITNQFSYRGQNERLLKCPSNEPKKPDFHQHTPKDLPIFLLQ